jgi:hypothetical protein
MKYVKETPRLTVKFIDADTEKTLFEVKDRSWMNVGELLTDYYVDTIVKNELGDKKLPKNLMVLVVCEFKLE